MTRQFMVAATFALAALSMQLVACGHKVPAGGSEVRHGAHDAGARGGPSSGKELCSSDHPAMVCQGQTARPEILPSDMRATNLAPGDGGLPSRGANGDPPRERMDGGAGQPPGSRGDAAQDAEVERSPLDADMAIGAAPDPAPPSTTDAAVDDAATGDAHVLADDSDGGGTGMEACDEANPCVEGPGASRHAWEVLWVRVWRRHNEEPVVGGAGGSMFRVAGPEQRIHFVTGCYDFVFGLHCDSWRGTYALNHVASDGTDHQSFRIAWMFTTWLSYGVDATGRIVVGHTTYPSTSAGGETGHVKSHALDGSTYWTFATNSVRSFVSYLVADQSGHITFRGESTPYYGGLGVDYGDGPVLGDVLVRFDSEGVLQWYRPLPMGTRMSLHAGVDGEVFGVTVHPAELECPPVSGPSATNLVKLDAAGNCLWARGLSADTEAAHRLVVRDAGDPYLAMLTTEVAPLGAELLTPRSQRDFVLARLNTDGSARWGHRWPAESVTDVRIAVSTNGQLLVSGIMEPGMIDLGSGEIDSVHPSYFFARYDGDGRLLGYHFMTRPEGAVRALQIGADEEGNAIVGVSDGRVDLGTGEDTIIHEVSAGLENPPEHLALRVAKVRIGERTP